MLHRFQFLKRAANNLITQLSHLLTLSGSVLSAVVPDQKGQARMGHPFFLCAHGVLVAGVADHTVIDKWSGLVRLRLVVRVCEDELFDDTEKTIRDSEVQ